MTIRTIHRLFFVTALSGCAVASGEDSSTEDDGDAQDEATSTSEAALSALSYTPTGFNNGFESGDLSGWRCSGNCPTVTKSPVAEGRFAGNFLLNRKMPVSYRTEATVAATTTRFSFDEEYWIDMKYRYEDWAKDRDAEIAPFQIHNTPSDWNAEAGCALGSAVSTAPFLMMSVNDRVRFVTYGGRTMWEAPIKKKAWMALRVHFRISPKKTGFVEAWLDGLKIGRVDGQTSAAGDKCGQPLREPYFKMGVYKWNWRENRPATDTTTRQLIIDAVSIRKD